MSVAIRANFVRWQDWCARSSSRRIFAAGITVASLTAAVKLAGAAKLVAIAHRFGASDALDAFLIASILPAFLAEAVGASVNPAFLPALIATREKEGPAAAHRLFASTTTLACALLSAVSLLLFAGRGLAPRILGASFNTAKLRACESLITIMVPVVVLLGIGSIWRGALNASDRFALAAGVPAITPLVTICLLMVAGPHPGADTLAVATLAGALVELLVIGYAVKRQGYPLVPHWYGWTPMLCRVRREYIPVVGSAIVTSGALLVDPAMAASLGSGNVSALNYGCKLATVLVAIGPAAIGTASLPVLSKMAALNDRHGVTHTLRIYAWLILLVSLPATALLIGLSTPVARLLYERGSFTPFDTALVAAIQRFSLLQLPFAMLTALMMRIVSALCANRVLLWLAAASLFLNTALDLVLMHWWGVRGIALASALAASVCCCILGVIVRRLLSKGASAS